MEPTFTFRNIAATDALRAHAAEKIDRLEKYWQRPATIHFILAVEHLDHRAELTITDGGEQLVGHATTPDMYASIDQAVRKVEHQLQRRKDRKTNRKGRPSIPELSLTPEESSE
ncbi:MAG: ribosome-associated translation inhibitor RaiA [Deltaproteobacteria bacterium]|nr:ribosome-associated translation inhibitor RaiA [Deltaproteobacteria bacterium]